MSQKQKAAQLADWIQENKMKLYVDDSPDSETALEIIRKYKLDDYCDIVETSNNEAPRLLTSGNGVKKDLGKIEDFAYLLAARIGEIGNQQLKEIYGINQS